MRSISPEFLETFISDMEEHVDLSRKSLDSVWFVNHLHHLKVTIDNKVFYKGTSARMRQIIYEEAAYPVIVVVAVAHDQEPSKCLVAKFEKSTTFGPSLNFIWKSETQMHSILFKQRIVQPT